MLWFDPLLSVSGKLLNLSTVFSESLVDLLYNMFQESNGGADGVK